MTKDRNELEFVIIIAVIFFKVTVSFKVRLTSIKTADKMADQLKIAKYTHIEEKVKISKNRTSKKEFELVGKFGTFS